MKLKHSSIYLLCAACSFVQAEEVFDLNEVTIEIVDEGVEIAHQIPLPTLELELEVENDTSSPILVREKRETQMAAREHEIFSEERAAADNEVEMAEMMHESQFQEAESENLAFELEDQFLDLVEEEASEFVQMSKQEFKEAMGMADEMLQLAEEQAFEVEKEVEENDENLGEEHRDEAVLNEEIEQYDDSGKEEGTEVPEGAYHK